MFRQNDFTMYLNAHLFFCFQQPYKERSRSSTCTEYETNISHLPIAEPFLIGTPGFWRVQFTPGLQVEHSIYGTRLCFKNMFTPKVQDKSNTYYPNTTQKKGKDIEN